MTNIQAGYVLADSEKRSSISSMIKKPKLLPRGIRNNNPLNIRIGNVWLGEVSEPTDPDFEQFVTMAYGCRAAFVLLRRYINHYKRTTIPQVIAAWAPASENDCVAYVGRVCQLSGITPDEELNFFNKDQMTRLLAAMAQVECGQPIKEEDINTGYDMA